jgi:hypothetical protein
VAEQAVEVPHASALFQQGRWSVVGDGRNAAFMRSAFINAGCLCRNAVASAPTTVTGPVFGSARIKPIQTRGLGAAPRYNW